jgi:iron complex outermembrane recepter protein
MIVSNRPFAVTLLSAFIAVPSALTGTAQAADAKPDTGALEEVVVTAQNRAENVQTVPIAINVISADKIAETGFSDVSDLGKITPAVQVVNDNSAIRVTVRGVGTNSNDETQDTSVVVNVDGEYINRPNVIGASMFDLERIEVLRGPQGTLYGRNSTGGAINFITRKPGEKFAVNASASYGNYNARKIDAGVDIPLGTTASIRFSGIYTDHDGYFDHPATALPFPPFTALAPAAKSNSEKNTAGRVSLRLNPVDALTINLAAEHAKRDFVNQAYQTVDLNAPGNGPTGPGCNAPGFVQVAPNNPDTLCIPKDTNFLPSLSRSTFGQPFFGVGGYSRDSTAERWRIAYRFGPAATLTYIGGYRSTGGTGHQGLPVVYESFTFQDDTKTQSHELRLNGEVGGATYQAGIFYFKEKLASETGFAIPVPDFLNHSFLSYFGRYVDSDSKSAFGQVELPWGDKLKAIGGLRYTDNKRTGVYKNGSLFGQFGPNPGLFGQGTGRKDFDAIQAPVLDLSSNDTKTTWLVGLNYTPAVHTLLYGKVSTGFKGGGFDSAGTVFKPESNTAFEVGLKKNFGATGQHYFNASAFHYNYKDLQTSVLLNTAVGGQTFNAGKATIWGLELETGLRLSDGDYFSASLNYLDAKFDQFYGQYNVFCVGGCGTTGITDLDPNTPGIQYANFAGNTPGFSPKVTASVGYDHVFRLGDAGTLTANLSALYKSSYFTDFFNYRDLQQDAYVQGDVSLEYQPLSKHFGVQAFVHNLNDKRPLTYAGYIAAGPDDILNWGFGTPRVYGLRLSVDY